MRVVILIPRREDGGWRDQLWAFCRAKWEREFPDWPIFEGHHDASEGLFNRSAGINRAAAQAGDWDVALIIDGDTMSEPAAVRRAVEYAAKTGALSVAHNARLMMSERGTRQFLQNPSMSIRRHMVQKTYHDSVSCAVAVSRPTWDLVGGFDERFVGWGFEDTAFRIAVETLTDRTMHVEQANCYHLWHQSSPEASHLAPSFAKNNALKVRYEQAHFQPERIKAVLQGLPDPSLTVTTIPRILHRTVPERTSPEVEAWWAKFASMHPQWDLRTYRDPLDPAEWPISGHLFDRCANGAQKAGLVRLEALVTHGGVYVDSDVEPIRPLDALIHLPAFAAWEDEKVVPDAVLGAAPGHPAFRELLRRAVGLIERGSVDAWETGPGGTTSILPWRDDVLLLPPGSFYPVHYRERDKLGSRNTQPWVFLEHKWNHSWGTEKQKAAIARLQQSKVSEHVEFPEGTVICIPWRDDGDRYRRAAMDWCMDFWAGHGLTVHLGSGQSRAEMCNDAARKAIAAGAKVLILADADTWASIGQVAAAAQHAVETGHLVHAFTDYAKIQSAMTQRHMRVGTTNPGVIARGAQMKPNHTSGLTAISVESWSKLGGLDERFDKWGFEDQALELAAETLLGPVERVFGTAIHWYHRSDPTKARMLPADDPTVKLIGKYCGAAGIAPTAGRLGRMIVSGLVDRTPVYGTGPDAVRFVLGEPGGPLAQPVAVSG